MNIHPTRRQMLALSAGFLAPRSAWAVVKEITWDDLIPPGVPYAEIVGEGEMDQVNDTWLPVFDENATKLNDALNGTLVRMPGYVIPMDMDADGATSFILVPYVGACIHVPPPPANQLVFVTTQRPWKVGDLWDAIWVTGTLRTLMQSTELAEIGYALSATLIEPYD